MSSNDITPNSSPYVSNRSFSIKSRNLIHQNIFKKFEALLPLIIPPINKKPKGSSHVALETPIRRLSTVISRKEKQYSHANYPSLSPSRRKWSPIKKLEPIPQTNKVIETKVRSIPEAGHRSTRIITKGPPRSHPQLNITCETKEDNTDQISTEIIEKSKEILKTLESPFEVYQRVAEKNISRDEKGNLTTHKTTTEKLKNILKKLDLKADIIYSGNDKPLFTEMKKLPYEYYLKAKIFRKLETKQTLEDKSQEEDGKNNPTLCEGQPEIKLQVIDDEDLNENQDSTKRDNNKENAGSSIECRTKPDYSTLESSPAARDENLGSFDNSRRQDDRFLSPFSRALNAPESSVISLKSLSRRSVLPEATENKLEKSKSKESEFTLNLAEDEGRTTRELRMKDKKLWANHKISNLGQVITNIKSETDKDLKFLNNIKRGYIHEMKTFERIKLRGVSEEQMSFDQEFYEDVMNQKNKSINEKSLLKNGLKGGLSRIKNKQERLLENIRFEKNIAKFEKKMEEKTRAKLVSTSPTKKRLLSDY